MIKVEADCGAPGRPKVYGLNPPSWQEDQHPPRYCLPPHPGAHSTNNCAPAPPSKEPGARPVFQYLVSCQPVFPTCVPTLVLQFLCLELSIFTRTQYAEKIPGTPVVPVMCSVGNVILTQHQHQHQQQQIYVFDKQGNLCVS